MSNKSVQVYAIPKLWSVLLKADIESGATQYRTRLLSRARGILLFENQLFGALPDGSAVIVDGPWSSARLAELAAQLSGTLDPSKRVVIERDADGSLVTRRNLMRSDWLPEDKTHMFYYAHPSVGVCANNPFIQNHIVAVIESLPEAIGLLPLFLRFCEYGDNYLAAFRLAGAVPKGFVDPRWAVGRLFEGVFNNAVSNIAGFNLKLPGQLRQRQLEPYWMGTTGILTNTHPLPVYYVKRDLVRALMYSVLETSVDLQELKWPHPGMVIVLEEGAIESKVGSGRSGSLVCMSAAKLRRGKVYTTDVGGIAIDSTFTKEDCFFMHSIALDKAGPFTASIDAHDTDLLYEAELPELKYKKNQPVPYMEHQDAKGKFYIGWLVRLLMLLAVRPDLVTIDKDTGVKLVGKQFKIQGIKGEHLNPGVLNETTWVEPYCFNDE